MARPGSQHADPNRTILDRLRARGLWQPERGRQREQLFSVLSRRADRHHLLRGLQVLVQDAVHDGREYGSAYGHARAESAGAVGGGAGGAGQVAEMEEVL